MYPILIPTAIVKEGTTVTITVESKDSYGVAFSSMRYTRSFENEEIAEQVYRDATNNSVDVREWELLVAHNPQPGLWDPQPLPFAGTEGEDNAV